MSEPVQNPLDQPQSDAALAFAAERLQAAGVPLLGVTGTNGKSSVTDFTAQLLRAAGLRVFAGGNLGHPLTEALSQTDELDVAVVEVSSYQLELPGKLAPHAAVLLNLSPDHLGRHKTMENYATTKARLFGQMRLGGQVIWATRFKEQVTVTGGGKGAPPTPQTASYSYSVSLAVALCEGEIARVGRVWADGSELARSDLTMRVYRGTQDQMPDPKMEAVEGAGQVPAYRGVAYVVIEDLDLSPYGNRIPQLSFEVFRPARPMGLDSPPQPSEAIRAVALMPGTGEYALATTPVSYGHGLGQAESANVNTATGGTDFEVALEALDGELPNCGAVSLIVSWFGDDLRAGQCSVKPKVEQSAADGIGMPWQVAGLTRATAEVIAQVEGRAIYGGTPCDRSVIEAIEALNAAGQEVMIYPFLLMEILDGNGLPDPWSEAGDQPALPWRGRITGQKAPGLAGSPDGTPAAAAEVAAFFGTASASDFSVSPGAVSYAGPAEWSYRRFVLHLAALAAAAGGVESFCIGSELRALTQLRDESGFPAVAQLIALAAEVRALLPDAKISYAADWSEYFGYHPQDGTGDVYFHLDPLWADANIDFVGIDNYMPLSDWRAGRAHRRHFLPDAYAPGGETAR